MVVILFSFLLLIQRSKMKKRVKFVDNIQTFPSLIIERAGSFLKFKFFFYFKLEGNVKLKRHLIAYQ